MQRMLKSFEFVAMRCNALQMLLDGRQFGYAGQAQNQRLKKT